VGGASAVLSLVKNAQRKTLNVVAKAGTSQIFSSPALDTKLSEQGMLLGAVPRGAGEQTIAVPGVNASMRITAFTAVRVASTSYIVVQLATPAKVTSYKAVVVPAGYL